MALFTSDLARNFAIGFVLGALAIRFSDGAGHVAERNA